MSYQKIQNTCKSVLTIEDYLDSCPLFGSSFYAGSTIEKLTSVASGRGLHYTLGFFKNNWEDNGFIEYVKNPQKMFEDASRMPSVESASANRESVPKIYNGLWITNKENPRKITYTLEDFIVQSKKLVGYQTIIWTNIESDKLKEMNPLLEQENIIVKNIGDLDSQHTQLVDFVLNPKKYLTSNNSQNFNGVIIDIAKYLIMESQGGILADFNFKFDVNFDQTKLDNYDFMAPLRGFNRLENGFFAAKPHHVIFTELLNIIDEMINNPECSLKLFRDTVSLENATELLSMMPLAMAYIKYNNINGNRDGGIYKCSTREIKSISIDKIQKHQEMESLLYSNDFDGDFSQYVDSYLQLIAGNKEGNLNCIDEFIGVDNILSMTWWDAGITA